MSKIVINMHTLLTKLKAYKDQVNKTISNGTYIKFLNTNEIGTKEQVEKKIQSDFDSSKAIIKNIIALETAKLESNSKTIIMVRGKEMTVAQALQRLSTLDMEMKFLNELESQFNSQSMRYTSTMEYLATETKKNLERMKAQRTSENPMTVDEIDAFMKLSESANTIILLDPMKVSDYILQYRKEIDGLKVEIDSILQTSNALTTVEVELED